MTARVFVAVSISGNRRVSFHKGALNDQGPSGRLCGFVHCPLSLRARIRLQGDKGSAIEVAEEPLRMIPAAGDVHARY